MSFKKEITSNGTIPYVISNNIFQLLINTYGNMYVLKHNNTYIYNKNTFLIIKYECNGKL